MRIKLLFFLLLSTCAFSQLTLTTPSPLEVCDINNDGFSVFDLTLKDSEITASLPAGSYVVAYFETYTDAQVGVNAISPAQSYYNIMSSVQTVYVRVTDFNNSVNVGFTTLTIHVLPVPFAVQPPDLTIYQSPYIGNAGFNLLGQRMFITNGQANVSVAFYLSAADAQSGTNALPLCFTNTSSPQTIWARAVNNYTGCYSLTSFNLIVSPDANPNPAVSIPDANFKAKLLQTGVGSNSCGQWLMIDSNADGEIQTDEALRVGRLSLNSSGISSMEGIRSFTNLEVLSCADNQLTELDLSGLYFLGSMDCSINQLTTLDLSETHVQTLSCSNNALTYINLKNGVDYYLPAEFPGFWNNNPLQYVCADSSDLPAIDGTLSLSMITGVTVVTDCSLGIDEQIAGGAISIYPNPADDIVNIRSASVVRTVGVFDLGGRKIASHTIGGNEASIDISHFESGVYIIRIVSDDGEKTQKIIKK